MKIAAYTALCYGADYLAWSIKSVIDSVDEYIVLYSDTGSHSGRQNRLKPKGEARSKLYSIAYGAARNKLKWVNGGWLHEGQQRDSVWDHTDADFVLVVDYDEIWPEGTAENLLSYCATHKANIRVPLIHFWRSFDWAITDDMAAPVRVLARGVTNSAPAGDERLLHFGYAIPDGLMEYKWTIHGHYNELRADINWFKDRWGVFSKDDVHPTNVNYWNAQRVNPADYLPGFMMKHPYKGLEVIK